MDAADSPELCPRCGRVVDEHTVAEFRSCMADLHEHDLPFEQIPETQQALDTVLAGSVAVKAAVHDSELGSFPVLVFEFGTPEGPLAPISLVLDTDHMRSVRRLVGSAVDAALKATVKHRNERER